MVVKKGPKIKVFDTVAFIKIYADTIEFNWFIYAQFIDLHRFPVCSLYNYCTTIVNIDCCEKKIVSYGSGFWSLFHTS